LWLQPSSRNKTLHEDCSPLVRSSVTSGLYGKRQETELSYLRTNTGSLIRRKRHLQPIMLPYLFACARFLLLGRISHFCSQQHVPRLLLTFSTFFVATGPRFKFG
jgi:hypothetical protein